LPRDSRQRVTPAAELGEKLLKKYSTKSANGNDLVYWTKHVVWQVAGEIEALKATNEQNLANVAETFGANPTHSHVRTIYHDLLSMVDEAATASKTTEPEKKVLTREHLLGWWNKHLQDTDAAQQRTSKPYRLGSEPFFAELHELTEASIRRALTSYDVRYEQKKWRSLQLADHLVDWLPEIALKASDLVSVQHLMMRQKTREAVRSIRQHSELTPEHLVAETLIHAIMRQTLGSEPIACKLFYASPTGLKSFTSAHIVHRTDADELWLGRARVATAESYAEMIDEVLDQLQHVLDPDFLKNERQTILTLREPQHLLPTTLEAALSRHAPIDDLMNALCIPVLIGYDSAVLGGGYADDYKMRLIDEVRKAYEELKPRLPGSLVQIKVHIFLLPIECVKTLSGQFAELMQAADHGL
jgi:hypothetical protein